MTSKRVFTLLLTLISLFLTYSHDRVKAEDIPSTELNLKFEHIDTQNSNLSQSSVFKILQDKEGFIWFATQNGLNKYDGYNFKIYKHDEQVKSLSDNWIETLFVDDTGTLWVGTLNGGVNKYDPESDGFDHITVDNGLSSNSVNDIVRDKNGMVWIGTDSGLNRLDVNTGKITVFKHTDHNPKSISNDAISDLSIDQNGFIWIGTEEGLNILNPSTEEITSLNLSVDSKMTKQDYIEFVLQDRSGLVWIGTVSGLKSYDPATGKIKVFLNDPMNNKSISNEHIQYIYEDRENRLWIGTNNGLNLFNSITNDFTRYIHSPSNQYSISEDNIRSIYQDESGILWVGTNSTGINTFSKQKNKFTHLYNDVLNSNTLDSNNVWSIFVDKSNQLWVGTVSGVNLFDPSRSTVKHFQNDPLSESSIGSGAVRSIFQDFEGAMWIGTQESLEKYDSSTQTFIQQRYPSDGPNLLVNIRSIAEDRNGTLWIGTKNNGLFSLNKTRTAYTKVPIKGAKWITSISEDQSGDLWIGTSNGLYRKTPTGIITYNNDGKEGSISYNQVRSLYQDKKGDIWVSTAGGGLNVYLQAQNRFVAYTEKDGLPNNSVYGVLEDDEGNLWASTDLGITKFNPVTKIFKNYDVRNGLQANEFNANAFHRSRDGEMFFGGINGLNIFFPDTIMNSTFTPPVRITKFETNNVILNRLESSNQTIHLSSNDNSFSIEYTSLDFTMPQKNQYAHKLEGFDSDWVYSGNRRYASYTNLNAGTYMLRIKGSNIDGMWSNQIFSVKIIVAQSIWKTWYAYTTYSLLILCLFWLITWYRFKAQNVQLAEQHKLNEKLVAMDRLKDNILASTTHELKTPLNGIIGITDSILEGFSGPINETIKKNLEIVVANGKRLNTLVSDILDFSRLEHQEMYIKMETLNLGQIVDEVIRVLNSLSVHNEIIIVNRIPNSVFVLGDADKIQQIMYNLIGNALKFTNLGSIEITAEGGSDYVTLNVADTGIGIHEDYLDMIFLPFEQIENPLTRQYGGNGLGLPISKKLIELHGGTLKVNSQVGQGTTFSFMLKIASNIPEIVAYGEKEPTEPEIIAKLESPKNQFANVKILIVDDDSSNIQVLKNYLAPNGWEIVVATNGYKALEVIDNDNIDIILLDIMMPGMSGFEVCEKIRKEFSIRELPIILISARDTQDDIKKGLEAGANDYLTKPISRSELMARIEDRLSLRHLEIEKIRSALTPKELEIIALYAQFPGETRTQILKRLSEKQGVSLSEKTLSTHITNINRKLKTESMSQAVEYAKKRSILNAG